MLENDSSDSPRPVTEDVPDVINQGLVLTPDRRLGYRRFVLNPNLPEGKIPPGWAFLWDQH